MIFDISSTCCEIKFLSLFSFYKIMTGDLNQAKIMGGIGSLLLVLSVVPKAGYILGIVGMVLLLIGIKNIADFFGRESVFKNALYAIIFGIIGFVAAAVFAITGILSIGAGFSIGKILGLLLLALVVLLVFYVLSAIFMKKSYDEIAQLTGISLFGTAGLLYLIGSILIIVLVGAIIILVAWILSTVAFFSIDPSKYTAPGTPAAPAPSTGPPPAPEITETPQPEPIEPS